MNREEICLRRSCWPDVDGPEGVNKFLENLGIEVKFLLDDGISFSYFPDCLEPYKIGEGTLYFKDPKTKDNLFHYYEDISDLVFVNMITSETYRIPIYEEEDFAKI